MKQPADILRHVMLAATWLILGALLLGATGPGATAQPAQVRAWTQSATVSLDGVVVYNLEVRSASPGTVETPNAPATSNLVPENVAPTAHREAAVEGAGLVESIVFRWTYHPLRTGTATIHPLALSVDGHTVQTETVEVSIVPRTELPANQEIDGSESMPRSHPRAASSVVNQDVLLRAVPSTRGAYVGEQIGVEYQLLFRDPVRPQGSRLEALSTAEGLWKEELEVDMQPELQRVTHEGETYNMIVLKREAFFATRPGTFSLSPLRVRTEVARRDRPGPISYFRGRSNEKVSLSSDSARIEAHPLPPNEPEEFQGAVGTFTLAASLSDREVEVGEGIEIDIQIEGSGNIALLEPLAFSAPDSVDLYGPRTQTEINRTGSMLRGTKTFSYTVVARGEGTLSLPDISFAYFDPTAERFRVLREALPSITVRTPAPSIGADLARQEAEPTSPSLLFAWLLAALVAAGLVAIAYRAMRSTSDQNPVDFDAAIRDSEVETLRACRALENGDATRFFEHIEKMMMTSLATYVDDDLRGSSRSELAQLLTERARLPRALVERLLKVLEACDRARYAPEKVSREWMEHILREARTCIEALPPASHA